MIRLILRVTVLLFVNVGLIMPPGLAAQSAKTTAANRLQGTVFTGERTAPDFVAGATVVLYGDNGVASTTTDQHGKFSFPNAGPAGIYGLEVTYSGLHAEQNVKVRAGAVVQVSVRLKAPDPSVSAKP